METITLKEGEELIYHPEYEEGLEYVDITDSNDIPLSKTFLKIRIVIEPTCKLYKDKKGELK
jgi:hypothetical protein